MFLSTLNATAFGNGLPIITINFHLALLEGFDFASLSPAPDFCLEPAHVVKAGTLPARDTGDSPSILSPHSSGRVKGDSGLRPEVAVGRVCETTPGRAESERERERKRERERVTWLEGNIRVLSCPTMN